MDGGFVRPLCSMHKHIFDQNFGKGTLELSTLSEHMLTSRCLPWSRFLRSHDKSSYTCRRKAHLWVMHYSWVSENWSEVNEILYCLDCPV